MRSDFAAGMVAGVVLLVGLTVTAAIMATESGPVIARREAECKRQLATATASDSLRVYRLQPKCFEAKP